MKKLMIIIAVCLCSCGETEQPKSTITPPQNPKVTYKFCNENLPSPYHLFFDESDTTYAIGYYYYGEVEYLYDWGTLGVMFNFPECSSHPKPFYKDSCTIKEIFFNNVLIKNKIKQLH
jgi:hypothetical protein